MDLYEFFSRHDIQYERHDHPAVFTVEEAERLVPPLPGKKLKNLFLCDGKGKRHFLVALPARKSVDLKRLAAVLEASKLRFASPERLKRILGLEPGAVSILEVLNDPNRKVELIVDKGIWKAKLLQCHPLINTSTLVISLAHIKRFLALTRHEPTVLDVPTPRKGPRGPGKKDVLSHSVESYTAIAFNRRPKPERPLLRPAYQGSNPISDIWSLKAMHMVAEHLIRFFDDPGDAKARAMMSLAASFAGVGFGNAGVTLPHGMSYPVSGMVREFRPEGYPVDHPIIPHGMAVVLNAPAAFRFTGPASPERHLRAAETLGANIAGSLWTLPAKFWRSA